jgi:hypothetical protein
MHNDGEKKKYTWTVLRDFTDGPTNVTVRVQANDAYRPRYSVQVGRLGDKGSGTFLAPHLPMYNEVQHARVTSVSDYAEVVSRLMIEARTYIQERMQIREDEIMAEKIAKEDKRSFKQKPTMGLKNLSKQDAAKYAMKQVAG